MASQPFDATSRRAAAILFRRRSNASGTRTTQFPNVSAPGQQHLLATIGGVYGLLKPIRMTSAAITRAALAEGETVGPRANILERDHERSFRDWSRLPNELIQAGFLDTAPSLSIDIEAMIGPGNGTIDCDAKAHGLRRVERTHDEVHVARVKPIRDAALCGIRCNEPSIHCPVTGQGPLVQGQVRRGGVAVASAENSTTHRGETFGAIIVEIILRRFQIGPVSGGLKSLALHRRQVVTEASGPASVRSCWMTRSDSS